MEKQTDKDQQNKKAEVRRKKWKGLSKIVGYTVPLDGLMCALDGCAHIDVIKFDKLLQTPDGVSMSAHIKAQYGEEAERLTQELL